MKPFIQLAILAIFCSQLFSCSRSPDRIDSKKLPLEKRLVTFVDVIHPLTTISDCDYDLFQTGGFEGRDVAMGPTDYDYKFVVKVHGDDIEEWIEGAKSSPGTPTDAELVNYLKSLRQNQWETHTEPECYADAYSRIIVYKEEGIIFKHFVSN